MYGDVDRKVMKSGADAGVRWRGSNRDAEKEELRWRGRDGRAQIDGLKWRD